MAMMLGGASGAMSEQDLVGLIDRRVEELLAGRILEFGNTEMFLQTMITIVEPANGKIAGEAATRKQVKEEVVKMQALTTQLDEKLKRTVQ